MIEFSSLSMWILYLYFSEQYLILYAIYKFAVFFFLFYFLVHSFGTARCTRPGHQCHCQKGPSGHAGWPAQRGPLARFKGGKLARVCYGVRRRLQRQRHGVEAIPNYRPWLVRRGGQSRTREGWSRHLLVIGATAIDGTMATADADYRRRTNDHGDG